MVRIDPFEGLNRMILVDQYFHSGIYDNRTPGGKGQWVLGQDLKPAEALAKYRYPVPYLDVDPQEFRRQFIKLLTHAAKQSDVPCVEAHTILSNLRKRLPRPGSSWAKINCMVMKHATWQRNIIQPANATITWRDLGAPWKKFFRDIEDVSHVLFDNNIPSNLVLGLSFPENVGVLTYSEWPWRVGALVDQNYVRAVEIK